MVWLRMRGERWGFIAYNLPFKKIQPLVCEEELHWLALHEVSWVVKTLACVARKPARIP